MCVNKKAERHIAAPPTPNLISLSLRSFLLPALLYQSAEAAERLVAIHEARGVGGVAGMLCHRRFGMVLNADKERLVGPLHRLDDVEAAGLRDGGHF